MNSLFGLSGMVRVEGMCWMLAERGDARRVAQLVMTEHEGTSDTCTSTGSGDVALVRFLTDHPRLMVVGWAHSHHTEHLSTPSAADVAQQWRLHVSVDPAFAMVINWRRGLQPNDGHACWRLAPSCVMELTAARGVVNTRAATPSSYLVPVPLHYEEYVMPLVRLGKHRRSTGGGGGALPARAARARPRVCLRLGPPPAPLARASAGRVRRRSCYSSAAKGR